MFTDKYDNCTFDNSNNNAINNNDIDNDMLSECLNDKFKNTFIEFIHKPTTIFNNVCYYENSINIYYSNNKDIEFYNNKEAFDINTCKYLIKNPHCIKKITLKCIDCSKKTIFMHHKLFVNYILDNSLNCKCESVCSICDTHTDNITTCCKQLTCIKCIKKISKCPYCRSDI